MKERGLLCRNWKAHLDDSSGETKSIQPAHPYLLTVNQIPFDLRSHWGRAARNVSLRFLGQDLRRGEALGGGKRPAMRGRNRRGSESIELILELIS